MTSKSKKTPVLFQITAKGERPRVRRSQRGADRLVKRLRARRRQQIAVTVFVPRRAA